jgi:predicted nucleic acid-binding protein
VLYLDSSAIVKLVVPEPESRSLAAAIDGKPDVVSSVLSRVEVLRAIQRSGAGSPVAERAEAIFGRIALVRLEEPILRDAAAMGPTELRTLDAIHLATALTISPDALITYDARLGKAARAAGLTVEAPR